MYIINIFRHYKSRIYSDIVIPNLQSNQSYNLTIRSYNLAGFSKDVNYIINTTFEVNEIDNLESDNYTVIHAGTVEPWILYDPNIIFTFYVILLFILIFEFVVKMSKKPTSNFFRFFNIRVTKKFSLTPLSLIISFGIASVSVYLAYATMINVSNMKYPYSSTNGALLRGIGKSIEIALGLILLPTSKSTVINRLFGWTIVSNIHFHKLLGIIIFVCVFIHSIGMILNYFASTSLYLLFSLDGDEYIILYAMIAFFLLIITAITSTKCIKNNSYTLFYHVYIFICYL